MRVERARTEGCLPDSLPFSFVSTLSIRSYLLETDVDLTSPLRSVLLREVETIQSASPYAMKRRDGVREWVRRRTAQNARHSPPGRGSPSRGRGPQGRRTYSQRTQLEAQRQGTPRHTRLAHVVLWICEARRRRRGSVSSVRWDEHGTGLLLVAGAQEAWRRFAAARWVAALPAIRLRQIRGARASERALARRSQHGGQPGTSALQRWRLGEAAGHARAKANTRRIARGEGSEEARREGQGHS